MSFDAQCDIAALVYGPGENPDRLLVAFAADLRRAGRHAVGLIQTGHDCRSEHSDLGVVTVTDGQVVGLLSGGHPDVRGCRLDPSRFVELAARIADEIDAGADLVIVNRFGHLEAEGRGLAGVIAHALDADTPVLIAVPEKRFADWIRFCDGMSVRLPCHRDALERWWRSVSAPTVMAHHVRPDTFCGVAK